MVLISVLIKEDFYLGVNLQRTQDEENGYSLMDIAWAMIRSEVGRKSDKAEELGWVVMVRDTAEFHLHTDDNSAQIPAELWGGVS